jgi:hypothetical protein
LIDLRERGRCGSRGASRGGTGAGSHALRNKVRDGREERVDGLAEGVSLLSGNSAIDLAKERRNLREIVN